MFITLHFYFSSSAYSSALFSVSYIKHYFTCLYHLPLGILPVLFLTSCSNILFHFTSGTMLTFTWTLKHLFPVYSFSLAKQLNHSCFFLTYCQLSCLSITSRLLIWLWPFCFLCVFFFIILFSCIILFDWSLDLCWIIFSAVIHLHNLYTCQF